jgi:hypothetical protein
MGPMIQTEQIDMTWPFRAKVLSGEAIDKASVVSAPNIQSHYSERCIANQAMQKKTKTEQRSGTCTRGENKIRVNPNPNITLTGLPCIIFFMDAS